jgi:hypothetical protein
MADIKTHSDFLAIERVLIDFLTAEGDVRYDDDGEWRYYGDTGTGEFSVTALALAIVEARSRG